MPKSVRPLLVAALGVLGFISMPLWLPTASPLVSEVNLGKDAPLEQPDWPGVTLVDFGWVTGAYNVRNFLLPPAIFHWQPGQTRPEWHVETEGILGTYIDEGRLYYTELKRLSILDIDSGELLNEYSLVGAPTSGLGAVQLVPVGRDGDRLYLQNHDALGNLFVFDLAKEAFSEDRWSLCEQGRPFEVFYLKKEAAFVSLCITFNTGMPSYVTRLSPDAGTKTTVDMPQMGVDDFFAGNGFAMGQENLAYVVDSLSGELIEIDLERMQITRQASYRQPARESNPFREAIRWLYQLAARPAHAKMPLSQPAVSPDGRYLALGDDDWLGLHESDEVAWIIDLNNLQPTEKLILPRRAISFHFASERLLYILVAGDEHGEAQVLVYDMDSSQRGIYAVPEHGWITDMLP